MPIGAFDLHSFWSFCCCGFGLSFKVLYILTFNCIIFHLCLAQRHEDIFKGRHAKGIVRNSQFILRFFQCNQELGKVTHIIQIHCNTCHWSILQLLRSFSQNGTLIYQKHCDFDNLMSLFFLHGRKKENNENPMHVFKHRRSPLLADNFCPLHLPKWQTSRIPSDRTGSVTTGFTVPCSKDLSDSTPEFLRGNESTGETWSMGV